MNYNSHELWALVLELRNRVEVLESAQQPTIKESLTVAPVGSLVERVVSVIHQGMDLDLEARAAIREVAAWADQQGLQRTARKLREEAER